MASSGKRDVTIEKSEVVARAYRKIMDGRKDDLSRDEEAAVKQHEKQKEERLRWQYYETIPQKHWRSMSGRQAKILNEQASRYGIPFGGANVSLPKVVRALHDFLADNKHKLARDDDDLLSGPASPALERYREERALLARLVRLEREGELLPRDLVRLSLAKTAALIRAAGETLQKQFGDTAAELLYDAIEDAESEIERFFTQRHSAEAPVDVVD
ncbi:hypothetical protein [Aureliella helgolandensis]|uniref:Uncharacterized protein n=1 Tax=Aureliella helgolandensis TaxID=2527968 RepID=A0A518GBN7_9BACT|nr:hypothetical protein [Aureliella helgolandensis]QDV25950.1 hypothetical protein Q31a_43190 [Aureliella helgolandensis]